MDITKIVTAGTLSVLTMTWTSAGSAEECRPSKWGPQAEIGAANYLTAESVIDAVKLVKEGQSHPLGIVVDPNMPAFPPRKMMLQVVQPNQQFGRSLGESLGWPLAYNDDVTQLWWGTGPSFEFRHFQVNIAARTTSCLAPSEITATAILERKVKHASFATHMHPSL